MKEKNKWFLKFKSNPMSKIRLFCFHHSGGGASTYHRWLDHLSNEIELIAIQLPGRENRFSEPLTNDLNEIIFNISKEFSVYTEKPFIIFGHSLGALIGFEFVKAISQLYSLVPQHMIVSAAKAPHLPLQRKPLSQLDDISLKEELKLYNGINPIILNDNDLWILFAPIIRNDFSILEAYKNFGLEKILCDILALRGIHDDTVNEKEIRAWSASTTGKFEYLQFSGDHFFLKNHQKSIIDIINKLGRNNAF